MNLVAGKASPTFFSVDVKKVKVSVAIAKIGQICCAFFQYDGLFVTFEAKGIHLYIK
jgi:hypothetical protein